MNPRILSAGTVALILLALAVSWYREHHVAPTMEQQHAHQETLAAEQKAARVDTLYLSAKDSATAIRTRYHTLHDTVLAHLTDTVLVKREILKADTLLDRDSVALVRADSSMAAERDVATHVRGELAIALRPKIEPRLRTTLYALYDPLSATAAGSVQLAARIGGGLSLVARADQRLAVGEWARLYVGAGFTF